MRISVVQFAPSRGNVSANIALLDSLISSIDTDLVVFPELASTGYFFTDKQELLDLAGTPQDDPFVAWMRRLATERRCMVVGGFAERGEGDRLFNSAATITPDGGMQVYRKAHLFYKEGFVFDRGDTGFRIVEWERCRVGTMICYDWRFPEAARSLALAGADVIAHPSNLVVAAKLWGPVMSTRAFENRVICATANRYGSERNGSEELSFTGESRIVASNGDVVAQAPSMGSVVLTAELDHMATRHKSFNPYNDIFADRRPELYRMHVDTIDGGA